MHLSGGNQQKVVFAQVAADRAALAAARRADARRRRRRQGRDPPSAARLADEGLGVLVASSELPELLGLCDRIVVMHAGRTVAAFDAGVTEDVLRRASIGESEAA